MRSLNFDTLDNPNRCHCRFLHHGHLGYHGRLDRHDGHRFALVLHRHHGEVPRIGCIRFGMRSLNFDTLDNPNRHRYGCRLCCPGRFDRIVHLVGLCSGIHGRLDRHDGHRFALVLHRHHGEVPRIGCIRFGMRSLNFDTLDNPSRHRYGCRLCYLGRFDRIVHLVGLCSGSLRRFLFGRLYQSHGFVLHVVFLDEFLLPLR